MLLAFIISLAQDPDLQEEFLRDPVVVVMAREDLSEGEKELLLSSDPERLAETLTAELDAEPPTIGPPSTQLLMPMPAPWVYGAQTVTGFFWERRAHELVLTIFGTRLRGAYSRCSLRRENLHIAGVVGQVEGSDSGERVTITFDLPEPIPAGEYRTFVDPGMNMEELFLGDEMLDLHVSYDMPPDPRCKL